MTFVSDSEAEPETAAGTAAAQSPPWATAAGVKKLGTGERVDPATRARLI